MTEKGTYKVNDVRPSKDGSFQSMLCAMLLFVAICGIIILFTWLIKPSNTKLNEKASSKFHGDEKTTKLSQVNHTERGTTITITSTAKHEINTGHEITTLDTLTEKETKNPLIKNKDNTSAKTENTRTPKQLTPEPTIKKEGTTLQSSKQEETTTPEIQEKTTTILPRLKIPLTTITPKDETISTVVTEREEDTTTIQSKREETTTPEIQDETISTVVTEREEDTTTLQSKEEETTTPEIQEETTTILSRRKIPLTTITPKDEKITTVVTEREEDTTTLQSKEEETTTPEIQEETTTILSRRKIPLTTITPKDEKITTVVTERKEDTTTLQSSKQEETTSPEVQEETTTILSRRKIPLTTITSKDETITTVVTEREEDTTTIQSKREETTTPEIQEEATTILSRRKIPLTTITPKDETITTMVTERKEHATTLQSSKQEETTTPEIQEETTTILSRRKIPLTTIIPKGETISTVVTEREEDTTTLQSSKREETITPEIQEETTTMSPRRKIPLKTTTQTNEETTPSSSTTNVETKSHAFVFSAPQGETFDPENNDQTTEEPMNKCMSSICKTFSSQMLAQMNHEVGKCDSYYDFACGGNQMENTEEKIWMKISEELENVDSESSSNLHLFRNYFDKCLDHHIFCTNDTRIDEVKDILHLTISSNIPTTNINNEITKLLATLMLNDYAPLFDISVDISSNTKLFQFQLSLGRENTILQNENYMSQTQKKCMLDMKGKIASIKNVNMNSEYKLYLECNNNVDEYINNVMQSAKELNLDFITNDAGFQSKFTNFINNFKNLPKPEIQRIDSIKKNYELKKISELKADYPLIEWDVLFSQLVNENVNDDELVQVYFGKFLKTWFGQLNNVKQDLYKILYAMFANNLYTTFVPPSSTSNSETEKMCLKQSSKLLNEISSSMYLSAIRKMDLDSHINEINYIFSELKKNFDETLVNADWLKEESKISVLKKLRSMTLITNMAIWNNESIIDARMADVPINIKTYQKHSIELVKRYKKMIYKMWNQPADNPEYIWWYYQTVYSEHFFPIYALNKIVISPVKLLEIPKNIPKYVRLAKLYYLLGKAMGHHFDNTGIKYDVDLDSNSANAYEDLKKCSSNKIMHKQSIPFKRKILEYQITNTLPSLSLNNRIAEDIALKLTYDLYTTKIQSEKEIIWLSSTYSPAEISFIAIAQEHCKKISVEDVIIQLFENEELPGPILLKTILPNLQMFEEVVECPEGSTMSDQVLCPAFQDLEEFQEKK